MIKVVLDTNVLVSALIKRGKPRALILEVVKGNAQLILSKGILEELAEVAANDKIRKYAKEVDLKVPPNHQRRCRYGINKIKVHSSEG